ncbi:peptide chain release factor PrfB1, chloroplastic isoform X2 [Tanacetum coccineum]
MIDGGANVPRGKNRRPSNSAYLFIQHLCLLLIQTSFSGVEVMPLLPEDSLNVEIPEEDLQIGFLRASGSGGQNVNKVETTVRITHILSGVTEIHARDAN